MKEVLEIIRKYYPIIFFILIVILSVLLFQSYSTLSTERKQRERDEIINSQNIKALTDSIKVEFNKKLKAYEYSKDSYVVNKLKDLEKYNSDLYNELSKVKGDIISVIKSSVTGDLGGIKASNNLVVLDKKTNFYGLKFSTNYIDSGYQQKISGTSKFYVMPDEKTKDWTIKPDITVLDTNLNILKITYGMKNVTKGNDKGIKVFAISSSPKIKVTDLDGGYFIKNQISPIVKPKKWGIGPYIGAGLNSDTKLNPTFGYSIGVSVHYSILQW